MGWEAWFTLGVVALVLGLLVSTRVPADAVLIGAVTLLLVSGVLTTGEALSGLANPGMVVVGVLFVVVAGLRETGGIQRFSRLWGGRPRSEGRALVRMMLPVVGLSAFLNNTPVVAMLMPVVGDWAKKHGISVSKLYIPLSYAAILGGTCTLIGTSTNLVVNGLLIDAARHLAAAPGGTPAAGSPFALSLSAEGLGMFTITWVGVPCALVGLAYLALAAPRLLPVRRPAISPLDDPREYTLEMIVEPSSPLVGSTIEEAGLRHLPGAYLMEIDRDGRVMSAVASDERLAANDRLVFVGIVDSVVDLQKIRGLAPATDQVFKLDAPRSQRCLIEAVVSNTCPLIGRTVREGRFRAVYNAAIIAVARNGQRLRAKIGDVVLEPGDTLLLETHPEFAEQQRNSRDFFLVSQVADSSVPRHERAWIATAIMAGMVIVNALELLPLLEAALLAAGLMLLTRCVTATGARREVDWQVLVVIAAALGIGRAIEKTGLAQTVASTVIGMAGNNPWLVLAAIYALTTLVTELITNNAAAALVFPFALASAANLGVSFTPFAVAVMMGASASFATPIGYQTNMMVYGPGGYHFTDFLRIGLPLNVTLGLATVALAPLFFPFGG